jgi:hypothetical protein
MNALKKIFIAATMVLLALAGFWLGARFVLPAPRQVETSRMEQCLNLYYGYRQNNDQQQLASALQQIDLTPKDFQEIIDRFIYYRSQKSSMNQAMRLLKAFRAGYNIEAARVVSVSGFASEPFRLDAEILAVFEGQPELIKKAFEG